MEPGKSVLETLGLKPLFDNFFYQKKVLITGHTGFKGAWLSLWLQQLGAEVFGYSLEPPTDPNIFDLAEIGKGMVSHIDDIRNYSSLLAFMKKIEPNIVFHLAAQPIVRRSIQDPIETYSTNVTGTINLLEATRQVDSVNVLVNVTTDKCYKTSELLRGYTEDDPLGGDDPYSSSKACSEIVTAAYRTSFFSKGNISGNNVAIATARAGNVIGGGDWAEDRLIPDCIRAFLRGEKVLIRNKESVRPWQHVLEPLSGYLLLASKLSTDGSEYAEAWNFGPTESDTNSVGKVVSMLVEKWGESAEWETDESLQPDETLMLRLNTSKARSRLNWQPQWGLEKGLYKTIEWYKMFQKDDKGLLGITLNQIEEYEESFFA